MCLTNAGDDKQDQESIDDRLYGRRERTDDILERLDPTEEAHHSGKSKPEKTVIDFQSKKLST